MCISAALLHDPSHPHPVRLPEHYQRSARKLPEKCPDASASYLPISSSSPSSSVGLHSSHSSHSGLARCWPGPGPSTAGPPPRACRAAKSALRPNRQFGDAPPPADLLSCDCGLMPGTRNAAIRNPLVHIDDLSVAITTRKPSARFKISKHPSPRARGSTNTSRSLTVHDVEASLVEGAGLYPETCCMTELEEIFADLGISQYLDDFRSQGFDTWETILDITESDFDALGVKLGHRRKLQRKIANARGISSDRALGSPARNLAAEDREDPKSVRPDGRESSGGVGTQSVKRKYKRHPKPDVNAPDRPPSAYVIFSNKMRRDIEGQNLSFTEIAKLVGENWQALQPYEKEIYEQQANTQKEAYTTAMSDYKKTQNYKDYEKYLKEFKAKQSNQQQVSADADAKRPKLEPHPSQGSGTTSSGASQHGGDTPSGRMHESSPTTQWGDARGQGSPPLPSSSGGALPGYRDIVLGPVQHPVSWNDAQRDDAGFSQIPPQYPRMPYPGQHTAKSPRLTPSSQFAHRSANPGHHNPTPPPLPPPLISSESTSGSASTISSGAYYSPRTPMDTHSGPSPLNYLGQKPPPGTFENQLAPLQTPSLSPQNTNLGPLPPPNTGQQNYQSLPPVRDIYTPTNFDTTRREPPQKDNLDILAKAAELANKRGGPPPPPQPQP